MNYFNMNFEEFMIELGTDEMPVLMEKYCPTKKVPTLHDGKVIISDSLAICEYLSEYHLNNKGWPKDKVLRAKARMYTCEMHSGFPLIREQLSMDIRASNKPYQLSDKLSQEIKRIDAIWSTYQDDDFLLGDFGIIDCFYAPIAFRFKTFDIQTLSKQSQKYQQALLNLSAMKEWQASAKKETAVLIYERVFL